VDGKKYGQISKGRKEKGEQIKRKKRTKADRNRIVQGQGKAKEK
jgi:hypothetical protein